MTVYLDFDKIQSYNAPMELIIGGRSIGKTYTYAKMLARKFTKTGEQFAWVRRYRPELDKARATFFDELQDNNEIPGYRFKTEGDIGYCAKNTNAKKLEWVPCCHFFTAASAGNYKGTSYPKITHIVYDEYIRDVRTPPGYLPQDMAALFSLWKTISRKKPKCKLTLLSNACDLVNPIFQFLKIYDEPKEGFTWHLNKQCLLYYVKDAIFAEQERDTVVGRIISGTEYAGMMIDNTFSNANDSFIASKPSNARYKYGFKWHGVCYGVWYAEKTGLFYVTHKYTKDGLMFALTTNDHRPNLVMIERSSGLIKKLIELYRYGLVYFDKPTTREEFTNFARLCGIR